MKDLMGMMKKAQELQGKMQDVAGRSSATSWSRAAPAAALSPSSLTGKGELKGLKIDPSLFKEDDVEVLEDLIIAAHNDAKAQGRSRDAAPRCRK